MRIPIGVLLPLFAFSVCGWALNVTNLGTYQPPALAHYQDVYYATPGVAYICGSGGFSVINVANLNSISRTGHYATPNLEPNPNCAVTGNLALVCAQEIGLRVLNLTNPAAPSLHTLYAPGTFWEDAQFLDNQTAVVCMGNEGAGVLSLASPTSPSLLGSHATGFTYTRACVLTATHAYFADDTGIVIYSISGNTLSYVSALATNDAVVDIQYAPDRIYAAMGAAGVAIIDVSSPTTPAMLGQFTTSGLASKLSIAGNLCAVANWDDFEIYDVSNPADAQLVGFKYTPRRAMCIAMRNDSIVVGDWDVFRAYHYGIISGPDLEVSPRDIVFPATTVGSSRTETLTYTNYGGQNVVFSAVNINNPNYSLALDQSPLPPGQSRNAILTYTPTTGQTGTGQINNQTNDPDEPNLRLSLTGNPPPGGVAVGNAAPDFTLNVFSGGTWTLSQFHGRIVVMAFYASW